MVPILIRQVFLHFLEQPELFGFPGFVEHFPFCRDDLSNVSVQTLFQFLQKSLFSVKILHLVDFAQQATHEDHFCIPERYLYASRFQSGYLFLCHIDRRT